MEQQQHLERIPRRSAFWSVLHSLKWPLFLLAWLVLWAPVLVVLLLWQVPLFISLPFPFWGWACSFSSWYNTFGTAGWDNTSRPRYRHRRMSRNPAKSSFLDKDVQYPL